MLARLPFGIPALLGLALSLGLALYVWRRRSGASRRWAILLGVAVAWWCAGQLVWVLTDDPLWRRRVSQVQYVGITTAPVLWLVVALAYTGQRAWLARGRWAAFFVVPAVTVLLVLSNDSHALVWRAFEALPAESKARVSYGPWFYFHTLYSYALVFVASGLLALRFAASPLYRAQLAVVLLGPAAIMAANVLHLSAHGSLPVDPTPAGFAVGIGALTWALWRHRMFELLPLARGIALESLRDGILVLDGARRVVDSNPAARELLAGDELLGSALGPLLPQTTGPVGAERELRLPNGRRVELRLSAVAGEGEQAAPAGYVVLLRDVTEAREAQDRLLQAQQQLHALNRELEQLAHTDALTGLANRRRLVARLEEEWARAARHARPIALLLVDLDHFKRINDTHGHVVGDRVLAAAGRALGSLVRPADLPARYGGEEFALLLPETDLGGACEAARRVRRALGELRHADDHGRPFVVTVSVGVASAQPGTGSPQALLVSADTALYHTKATGRDGASSAGEAGVARFDPL